MALARQLRLKLEHEEDFRRDRLIVSRPNQDAVTTLDRWPGDGSGALALIGPAGAGKSHLAAAWARRTGARTLSLADLAEAATGTPGPILLEDADNATHGGAHGAAHATAHGEALFHLLNRSGRPGCALLLTGRTPPGAWPVTVADLRSRLNALQVLTLEEPDDAILRGVLVKLFAARHIRPPADLLAYLLTRMERSVPAAQAMVAALDEAAAHRPVSRSLARELLHDMEPDDA